MKEYHISSYLVYNIVSFCKMDGKTEPLWRSVEDELAVRYLENSEV